MVSDKKLVEVVNSYKQFRDSTPDYCIKHCKKQINLIAAIKVAAMCEDYQGKRHSHQYRISPKTLLLYSHNLLVNRSKIKVAKTFDELYSIAEQCKVHGIGPLTTYDVAHRIGEYLKIYPGKVYVHSGTRIGAELLIGRIKERAIERRHLPRVLANSDLTCADLEDLLCIYKDYFIGNPLRSGCKSTKLSTSIC